MSDVTDTAGSTSFSRATIALSDFYRLHVAVTAALAAFTFGYLFSGYCPWLLALICGLDWFLAGLFDRLFNLKEKQGGKSDAGSAFAARHRRSLLAAALVLLAGSLAAVHVLNPAITWLRVVFHCFALAFVRLPLPRGRRIRQLYVVGNVVTGLGFLVTVFGYPMATIWWGRWNGIFADGISVSTIWYSALFIFLFELSWGGLFDLGNVGRNNGPGVVHEEERAVTLIDTLLLACIGVLVMGYVLDQAPFRVFIMFIAPGLQLILYRRALKAGLTPRACINLAWLLAALLILHSLWLLTM